jgi:hypothetical protein
MNGLVVSRQGSEESRMSAREGKVLSDTKECEGPDAYPRLIDVVQPSRDNDGYEFGNCASCGIPISQTGGFKVRGLQGTYHCCVCLEQAIFYKDDPHRKNSKEANIGSGQLLGSYLIELESKSTKEATEGLCRNDQCKRGENQTRATVKTKRAKYCCPSCRVAVSRRAGGSSVTDNGKPKRKRRKDAKYNSHSERQRAYELRSRQKSLLEPVRLTDNTPPEPA